jgi:hypothetical protein
MRYIARKLLNFLTIGDQGSAIHLRRALKRSGLAAHHGDDHQKGGDEGQRGGRLDPSEPHAVAKSLPSLATSSGSVHTSLAPNGLLVRPA